MKIIQFVIGLVVVVTILATLMVPAIDDQTTHRETVTNDDLGNRATALNEPVEFVKGETSYTMNDVEYTTEDNGGDTLYIVTDVFIIRGQSTDGVFTALLGYGLINDGAPLVISGAMESATIGNGEWTIVKNSNTYTGTYEFAYMTKADGDKLIYSPSTSGGKLQNMESPVVTFRDNSQSYGVGSGKASEVTNDFQVTSGSEVSDYAEYVTAVEDDEGLYEITGSSGTHILIPYSVTVTVDNDDAASSLLKVIPLLVIASIVMIAAKLLYWKD